jgi:uncharacterized protein (TIGR02145 family)
VRVVGSVDVPAIPLNSTLEEMMIPSNEKAGKRLGLCWGIELLSLFRLKRTEMRNENRGILVLIVFSISLVCCNSDDGPNYSCTVNGCVEDIDGVYAEESNCIQNCNMQALTYSCVNGDCVVDLNGAYESHESCLNFCGQTIVSNPGSGVTDYSGNWYPTIVLGNGQEWMAENLNVSMYRNGDMIPLVSSNSQWEDLVNDGGSGAYCEYGLSSVHGKLYNWFAVTDARNLCPDGWHIPTFSEWNMLIEHLDPNTSGGGNVAGGMIKVEGTDFWNFPNTGASNISGFNGLPSGSRSVYGGFSDLGKKAFWWSSSLSGVANARSIYSRYDAENIASTNSFQGSGFAVRCVRD